MMYNLRYGPKENIPGIVQSKMPAHSVAALDHLMFCNSCTPDYIAQLPTATEYAHLQATIQGPFNFFHENLTNIHTRVTGPYDIINISNIFDRNYIGDMSQQSHILCNLAPLLRVGGTIVYDNQRGHTYPDVPMTLPNTDIDICHKRVTGPQMCIDLFQRTR